MLVLLLHRLFVVLSVLILHRAQAQAQPTVCTFSCPEVDANGQALLKRALALPWESEYSVFECVYGEVNAKPKTHSCFYNKVDGTRTLSGVKDGCPEQGVPCTDTSSRFSSPGHPEVPAWIENGRYLLYLKENHT